MDERRLTSLLQMAREAEAFDRELNAPGTIHAATPRSVDRPSHRPVRADKGGVRRALWMSLASAACVAMAFGAFVFFGTKPITPISPKPDPGRFAIDRGAVTPPSDTEPGVLATSRQTMMIALYRGDDGLGATCPDCWCVQRWVPTLESEQELAGRSKDELICDSIDRTCVKDPSHVVVVGLSGPPELLPTTDDTARDIAICLMEYQASTSEPETLDAAIGAMASAGCVASNVDVHIHSWAK